MSHNIDPLTVKGPRIEREKHTVSVMIELYCQDRHQTSGGLCPQCSTLHDYAMLRLHHCPFHEGKTTCVKCAVHCYRPEMREQIRVVMRYAGLRMIWKHPVLAMQHLIDRRRSEAISPSKPPRRP